MKVHLPDYLKHSGPLILLLWILVGCAAPDSSQSESNALVNVVALNSSVKLIREGNSENDVSRSEPADIQTNDRIQLNESGQGSIQFLGLIEIGLHQATEVQLLEARRGEDETAALHIFQTYGNTHIQMNDQPNTWITLRTDYVTVTNLEEGADFVICHKPDTITCGVVLKGSVAFVAEGKREIAEQGEAIYVRPGQPPSSPICIQEADVMDWLEKVKTSEPVDGLGAIVARWPQEPCAVAAQTNPTSEVEPLPTSQRMVRIDAGVYTIGAPIADEFHIAQREVQLDPYWIDQYEVTNEKYQQFLDDTGYQPPLVWPGDEGHPVRGVTWDDAAAYCAWEDKRIPGEAEWEVAARGPDPDWGVFPWGVDPFADGNVDELPLDGTYAVGSFAFNQSPFGVYDLAGNVWEWVGDPYEDISDGLRLLRGGRFGLIRDAAYRQTAEPDHERFVPYAGFRCVADRVEGE